MSKQDKKDKKKEAEAENDKRKIKVLKNAVKDLQKERADQDEAIQILRNRNQELE
jgi:hypothetical protein